MAVPKRKHSKSRTRKRRSHQSLHPTRWVSCDHCKQPKLPHHVCPHCGYYKGRMVVQVEGG